MMRIAVIIDNICLAGLDSTTKKIMLFETDNDLVIAIDEDIISLSNMNYLCLWLLGKHAEKVYGNGINDAGKEFLEKAGITVHPLEDIREHPILKALLLKGNKTSVNDS